MGIENLSSVVRASGSWKAVAFGWPTRCAISSTRRPATTDASSRIGQLVLFSTETGDAWLLDHTDFLAARLARNGEAEPIQIVETAATFAIEWKGSYRINGPAFVYSDRDTGRVITVLGYPTDKLVGIK